MGLPQLDKTHYGGGTPQGSSRARPVGQPVGLLAVNGPLAAFQAQGALRKHFIGWRNLAIFGTAQLANPSGKDGALQQESDRERIMNLRKLYEHLDQDARQVLHRTAEMAAREGRKSISIEHFLLQLLRDKSSGALTMKALADAGADANAIETALAGASSKEERGLAGALPSFDESLAHLIREAWSLAFDEYGVGWVSPVRFFETILRRGDNWPKLVSLLPGLSNLDLAKLSAASSEQRAGGGGGGGGEAGAPAATDQRYPELSRFGRDMIKAALEEGFDPVVGQQDSMQAISSILLRRRQNSTVVVGEAGVGKTACALGFIDSIARKSKTVPDALHDTPIWSLNLSALRAGAVVRGALEERLQTIVKEVEADGMLLYIDDIHLLFGEQSSGADALRNILSDGGVRILGTCGWREYRRHVEPDPGLARRLAPVRIQEPDDATALKIIEGIAPTLEEHHGVAMGENVLESSVALSRRYIVGRQLPDKAIAVLDSACARARMAQSVEAPAAASEETAADGSEAAEGAEADAPAEKQAAKPAAGGSIPVVEDDVAAVVSDLTGVPVGGMLSDVGKAAAALEDNLRKRVVGQDEALARCASQARAYLAGLSDRRRPVGALMFCGPSGVGKTETALALADTLFGGRVLTINMSEYQEAHTVSGLKGAPAGYVGYGEGGVLTEGVRRTPYCVVLLDEIEKAHNDIIEMLYQVLDRGWMEDAEGIEADFSNALIILTSNAGDTVVEKAAFAEEPPTEEQFNDDLRKALRQHFPAAFIGRLQLVPYWPLGEDTLSTIAEMRLGRLAEAYGASHRSTLNFDQGVRSWLADRVKSTPQGARFLDGIIAGSIRPVVADYVIGRLSEDKAPGNSTVSMDGDSFVVRPDAA